MLKLVKDMIGDAALFKRGKTIVKAQMHVGDVPVTDGGLEPVYYHNKGNTHIQSVAQLRTQDFQDNIMQTYLLLIIDLLPIVKQRCITLLKA
ncbi:MAG: restriction endonuclease subunit S [Chloroflexi bacterium]|nr:restriction endonuclease subunit S [Chloroflexota bacterium]